jgi:histone deacetylase complex regulatory component SIN3
MQDALQFLYQVRSEVEPYIFLEFLDVLDDFEAQHVDTAGVIRRALGLFGQNRQLMLAFVSFVPEGYAIKLPEAVIVDKGPVYTAE